VGRPLISVVTPFYNTAAYLPQCIESVLAQTYPRFEYILSDNCSTDGSREIAASYARRDARIRLIQQPRLLPQVQHYNCALKEISDASHYCKIVQADDCIFPDCLHLMIQAFEQAETVGLVSSYYLKGNTVQASGFPYPATLLKGKEMARLYLRTGLYVFGSPTTVMYRSSLVRSNQPFYDDSLLHEDTEKCMQILEKWDFGFVHQVLSFLRTGNESISSSFRRFQPDALDGYIIVRRYAPVFLDAVEAAALRKGARRAYYRFLAHEAIRFRGAGFWSYHREGLKTLHETLSCSYVALQLGRELLGMLVNPGKTATRALQTLQRLVIRKDTSKR